MQCIHDVRVALQRLGGAVPLAFMRHLFLLPCQKDAASSNALVQFYRDLVEEQEVTPGEVSGA